MCAAHDEWTVALMTFVKMRMTKRDGAGQGFTGITNRRFCKKRKAFFIIVKPRAGSMRIEDGTFISPTKNLKSWWLYPMKLGQGKILH
jgi:hypothetical protein